MFINVVSDSSDSQGITIVEDNFNRVYFTSKTGEMVAAERHTGKILWVHKLTTSSINEVSPNGEHELFASTGDGKLVCLSFK